MMVVQKIVKECSQMEVAMAYYSIISSLNNLGLTTRELQLLSFIATRGITNPAAREDFCLTFSTSQATINNMISRLKKLKILVKDVNKKIKVNPAIALDFSSSITLQIQLKNVR